MKGLKASHYRLTYDHRSTLQIKDFLLSDHARFPVFHIEFQNRKYSAVESVVGGAGPGHGARKEKRGGNSRASVRYPGGLQAPPDRNPTLTAADIEELALISAEKEAISNGCAVSILYTEQHRNYGFGDGGEGVTSLYNIPKNGYVGSGSCPSLLPSSPYPSSSSAREGRLTLKARCISCLLSSTDIPLLIAEAMPAYHRVKGHIITAALTTANRHNEDSTTQPHTHNHSNPKTIPRNLSPVTMPPIPGSQEEVNSSAPTPTSVYLSVSYLDVALTTDEHLLARLHLDTIDLDLAPVLGVSVNTSNQHSAHTDSEKGEGGGLSLRASVQGLKLFDLTHSGSLHPMVIWKKGPVNSTQNNSSARNTGAFTVIPMITIALTIPRGERSRPTLTVSIQGLRACFLYRFIEEISIFITDRFIKAIHEAVSCSFPDSTFSSFSSDKHEHSIDEERGLFSAISNPLTKSESFSSDDGLESQRSVNHRLNPAMTPGAKGKGETYKSRDFEAGKEGVRGGEVPISNGDAPVPSSIEWCIELRDCTIIVPRNSCSNDAIAVSISKGSVQSLVVPVAWSAPEAMKSESGESLFFDHVANIWRFNMHDSPTPVNYTKSEGDPRNRTNEGLNINTSTGRRSCGEIDRDRINKGLEKSGSFSSFSDASSSMR